MLFTEIPPTPSLSQNSFAATNASTLDPSMLSSTQPQVVSRNEKNDSTKEEQKKISIPTPTAEPQVSSGETFTMADINHYLDMAKMLCDVVKFLGEELGSAEHPPGQWEWDYASYVKLCIAEISKLHDAVPNTKDLPQETLSRKNGLFKEYSAIVKNNSFYLDSYNKLVREQKAITECIQLLQAIVSADKAPEKLQNAENALVQWVSNLAETMEDAAEDHLDNNINTNVILTVCPRLAGLYKTVEQCRSTIEHYTNPQNYQGKQREQLQWCHQLLLDIENKILAKLRRQRK